MAHIYARVQPQRKHLQSDPTISDLTSLATRSLYERRIYRKPSQCVGHELWSLGRSLLLLRIGLKKARSLDSSLPLEKGTTPGMERKPEDMTETY